MKPPETRYARSGEARIAYQVVGHGPLDLVLVPGFISNLEVQWEDLGYSTLLRRLARFSRLIVFDPRGTGLSDRVGPRDAPSLATRIDDVRAVLDAAGSGRAALLGASEGAPIAIRFAATHPERTRALVLYGGYAHFHSAVMNEEALARFVAEAETAWGTGASLRHFAPGRVDDEHFRAWWSRFERLSASPTAAIVLTRSNARIDVRDVLPAIRTPTLVVHRSGDARVRPAGGRYLAERIAGARWVELPGRDHPVWTGDVDRVADEIESFLTGARPVLASDRVLAALSVARVVAPERLALRVGDRQASERIARFRELAAELVTRFGGRAFGDRLDACVATFDGPARAARCAIALREAVRALDVEIAAAVHAGEIEIGAGGPAGLAVHVAGRLAEHAGAGEILVSGVVTDLVAGSGLHFAPRGNEAFEGLDAPLRIFAVVAVEHLQPAPRPAPPGLDALSAREREVLDLVAKGFTNAAIAATLDLSDHTIKRHVANILLKLELPTRAAAAALTSGREPGF